LGQKVSYKVKLKHAICCQTAPCRVFPVLLRQQNGKVSGNIKLLKQ